MMDGRYGKIGGALPCHASEGLFWFSEDNMGTLRTSLGVLEEVAGDISRYLTLFDCFAALPPSKQGGWMEGKLRQNWGASPGHADTSLMAF